MATRAGCLSQAPANCEPQHRVFDTELPLHRTCPEALEGWRGARGDVTRAEPGLHQPLTARATNTTQRPGQPAQRHPPTFTPSLEGARERVSRPDTKQRPPF